MLVSAIGADAGSRIFYSRVKGETEKALEALEFEALHIFRPGVLLGERSDTRRGESLMMALTPVLNPLLRRRATIYRSIPAETVATAMLAAPGGIAEGRKVHTYDEMMALAGKG